MDFVAAEEFSARAKHVPPEQLILY